MKSKKHIVCLKIDTCTCFYATNPLVLTCCNPNLIFYKSRIYINILIIYTNIYRKSTCLSIVYFSIQMYDFWLLTCQLDIVWTDTKRLDFHHIKKFKGHTPLIGTLAASNGCIITNRIHLDKVSHMWLKGLEIFKSICFESWFAKWFISFKLRKFILWIYEGDS